MASATKIIPEPVPPPATYVLELSEQEARAIALCMNTSGIASALRRQFDEVNEPGTGTPRAIRKALSDVGLPGAYGNLKLP